METLQATRDDVPTVVRVRNRDSAYARISPWSPWSPNSIVFEQGLTVATACTLWSAQTLSREEGWFRKSGTRVDMCTHTHRYLTHQPAKPPSHWSSIQPRQSVYRHYISVRNGLCFYSRVCPKTKGKQEVGHGKKVY